ncbi:hypothetical protein CHS0354_041669 [Potamilus streckersoni]|uniref:G-protein coupled receptors family 1 profile domain-containing protein n=1 Tax=Potamilus streckersoni TaxID=2493646 RepID=A0AAE0VTH0_9BIVA|nr:hypothetical protein CHS0354_041669 [Potamilus streckersoni]
MTSTLSVAQDATESINVSNVADTGKISTAVNLYVPPILIIAGVICNLLIIITTRTKYFRSLSTSVYLATGAVNDMLSLLLALVPHWLYVNFPATYVRTDSSHWMCKFFNFYGWGNTDLGIIITSAMTAERATAIVFPLKSASICTRKRAKIIVVLIIVIVIVKEFHFFISSDIVPETRTERLCDVFPQDESYRIFWLHAWPWIHLCYLSACFLLILASNSVIIRQVRRSPADRISGVQRWRHIAPMLIGESVLLILLTFPFTIHLSGLALALRYNPDFYKDSANTATEKLTFSVTFYMLYSNKCANFLMYCVTGSRFRQGLLFALSAFSCEKRASRQPIKSTIYSTSVTMSTITLKSYRTYV